MVQSREERAAYMKVYQARPEVREARAAYSKLYAAKPESKVKNRESNRKYRAANAEKVWLSSKVYELRTRYNLTLAEWKAMFERQSNLCGVCHLPFGEDRPAYVDHDHKTNMVRGLLCPPCNTLLGFVRDDANLLQSGAEYLRNPVGRPQ